MSNNNINDEPKNDLSELKIQISQSEEDPEFSQSISLLNNQTKAKFIDIIKKYENEPSLEYSPKKKYDLDNLSSLQLSKMYHNMRNHQNKQLIEKHEKEIAAFKTEIESLNHDIKILQREKNSLKDEAEFLQLEKEKLLNVKNSEIELLKEQLNNLEEKYQREKEKSTGNEKKAKEYNNKADEYDVVYNKLKKCEEENNSLLTMNNNFSESVAKLQKENLIINEKYLELKTKIEELKISNDGLNQNILFYENKTQEKESQIKNLEEELKKVKLLNKNYEQIIADNELSVSKFNNNSFIVNNKINDEINDMKIIYEKKLLEQKNEYEKIMKSKTDDLILELNECKSQLDEYKLRLIDKERGVTLYKEQLDDLYNKTNGEINLMKIQLDNKENELNSQNSLYKEQMAKISVLKNENEKLNEKVKTAQADILYMQSDYMKKIDELKKENTISKGIIIKYEKIEDELAKVLNEKKNEIKLGDEKFFENLGKKRENQCLILMNSLKIMKIEIEKLKIENNQLNNELKIANDQCIVYKNISDKINQPYSYLVKNLQDKDIEVLKLNQVISNKDKAIDKLKKQCEIYENTINTMKNELRSIINNRKQIDNLENLLINYVNNENQGNINTKNIDRISYFLNNFNNNVSIDNTDFNKTSNNFNNKNHLSDHNNITYPQNMSLTMNNFNKNNFKTYNNFNNSNLNLNK